MRSFFLFQKNLGRLPFSKTWGRLPFSKKLRSSSCKKMRSSSIFKNCEVVFHISSSWVRIRLLTKNQLPRLPWSGLKCNHIRGVVVVAWCGFFTDYNTTPTKLFCFVLLVGLWQKQWKSSSFKKKIRSSSIFKNIIIIATTQPTTQNNTKQLGLCGIIIGKKKPHHHHHHTTDVITF